jgi:hypothetical protein
MRGGVSRRLLGVGGGGVVIGQYLVLTKIQGAALRKAVQGNRVEESVRTEVRETQCEGFYPSYPLLLPVRLLMVRVWVTVSMVMNIDLIWKGSALIIIDAY